MEKKFAPIDLLFFKKLSMPEVLTVIYWVALAGVLLSGLGLIFSGHFLTGLLSIILGALAVRVSFELVCVAFSINGHLEKLVEFQSIPTPSPTKKAKQPKTPPTDSEA